MLLDIMYDDKNTIIPTKAVVIRFEISNSVYRSIRFNFFRPSLVSPTKNNICYVATVFFSLHECFLSRLNKNKSSYMNQVFVRCCRRNEIVIQEWICTWIYSTLLKFFCKIGSRELIIKISPTNRYLIL